MSIERARAFLARKGLAERIRELDESSATVALAAAALHCEPARIAKTLAFAVNGAPLLLVTAGDARVDNIKFKAAFGGKGKMPTASEVESLVGHAPGGVCPFGARESVPVYLDESLKRFDVVFPAGGSASSAVELRVSELESACECACWVDVCGGWREESAAAQLTGEPIPAAKRLSDGSN